MKKTKRPFLAILAAVLMAATTPARAADASAPILFGVLAVLGISFTILAWQTDSGKNDKPLVVPDQTGRDKKTSSIEIVPPPQSNDESRPNEVAIGIAFATNF